MTVKNIENADLELTVFNANGTAVAHQKIQGNTFNFNRGILPDGIYVYEITVTNNTEKNYLSGKLFLQ
ncbi:MAG: T9SS type A sorting domain-containing protein [Bacteroidetes bacterium]|nr:T9SS type A sorting domain-containing protein [Bacteroidota bacterium]